MKPNENIAVSYFIQESVDSDTAVERSMVLKLRESRMPSYWHSLAKPRYEGHLETLSNTNNHISINLL